MSKCKFHNNESGEALVGMLEGVTSFGLKAGGVLFGLATVFLLYGLSSGQLKEIVGTPTPEQTQALVKIHYATLAVTFAGLTAVISAAIKFYEEEVLGYLFLIIGGLFYWGIPKALDPSIQQPNAANAVNAVAAKAAPIVHIVDQYQLVGMVALGLAVPFIALDLWYKLTGARSAGVKRSSSNAGAQKPKGNNFHIVCWQMSYCREHMKGHCKAYNQRRSCWHVKSGCYCDENLAARANKSQAGASAAAAASTQISEQPQAAAVKPLTPAQKNERCRQCFLYSEHQKMKYKVLSPLVFPITLGVMWIYHAPVKDFLIKSLKFVDWLISQFSFTHSSEQGSTSSWSQTAGMSDAVVWVFMICLCLVISALLLKALEYLIYEKQI